MANRRQIVTIYALVDPETHLVRYVGQTTRLASRYVEHCKGAYSATARWVRSLNYDPQLVVLETLPNEMVHDYLLDSNLNPCYIVLDGSFDTLSG